MGRSGSGVRQKLRGRYSGRELVVRQLADFLTQHSRQRTAQLAVASDARPKRKLSLIAHRCSVGSTD